MGQRDAAATAFNPNDGGMAAKYLGLRACFAAPTFAFSDTAPVFNFGAYRNSLIEPVAFLLLPVAHPLPLLSRRQAELD